MFVIYPDTKYIIHMYMQDEQKNVIGEKTRQKNEKLWYF